jgi:8-oxo-dGTP pyrophosphatase MutT (NUDIX family)/predicted amidohydrolase
VGTVTDLASVPLASESDKMPSSADHHSSAGDCRCGTCSAADRGDDPRTASGMACAPCVARPAALPDRVAAIQAAIGAETEPLVTLTHLLQLCRDEHPVLWERLNDPGSRDQVALIVSDVLAVLPAALTTSVLDPRVRRALAAALTADEGVPAVVVARALAELLDDRYSHSFAASFRRRSPYQPGVGDPIPLDSPNLRLVTEMPATSPPWRLANRLDETRHIRLAGDWTTQFQVIFDYSHSAALTGLMGPDTVLATCHPNRRLDEFAFPVDAAGLTFPVRPVDEQRQHREIDELIGAAVAAGASIVVLPELCVTESLAAQLQQWTCRADGPRLLVAGSYHHDDDDRDPAGAAKLGPRRRNTAIAYLRGCAAPLTQDKHSPADRPVNEDIQPPGWPQLRVHVSSDGWHLVIAICRDLLNPHAVHALTEAGVNLALVPAMSETLVAFGGPVAQMVGAEQAFVAVANNPADFSAATGLATRRPARALFGHPGFGQQTRLVQPADGEPGVALLRVRNRQLQWLSAAATAPPSPTSKADALPDWAAELGRRCGPDHSWKDGHVQQLPLRGAAVLVVLTDSADGPTVLLTERAPDLTQYPGQLVFPGGAADAADGGPVSTALREATEETGLDPSCVQILGTLPALALPESGFLMTPVLAWSAGPVFTGSSNLAEVSALSTRPLRATRPAPPPPDAAAPTAEGALGAATGIVIDLITGMLTHTQGQAGRSPGRASGRAPG